MAPDKIYVMPSTFMEFGYIDVVCKNKKGIEYIRKDALLAFLNKRRKELSSGDSFVAGERKMLKEIIEKIESL